MSGLMRWKRSLLCFFAGGIGVSSASSERLRLFAGGAGVGELRPTVAVDSEECLRSKGLLTFSTFTSGWESESESESDEDEESLDEELEALLEDAEVAFLPFTSVFVFLLGASDSLSDELDSLEDSEELEDEDEDEDTEAAFLIFVALAFFALDAELLSEPLEDELELASLEESDSGSGAFTAVASSESLPESPEDDDSDDASDDDSDGDSDSALESLTFFRGGAFSDSDSESELEVEESESKSGFVSSFVPFLACFAFFAGSSSSDSDSLLDSLLESLLDSSSASLLESLLASLSSTSMRSVTPSFFDSTPLARAPSSHSANILVKSGYPLAAFLIWPP